MRSYLSELASGRSPAPDASVWTALAPQNALIGSLDHPGLTPLGETVLRELTLRAYRTDSLPLDRVARDIGLTVGNLSRMATNAEYFLAEVGPVPPVEVVPELRIIAAALTGRPVAAEDIVSSFKAVWGEVEVLGGDDRDRLFAAGLLAGADFGRLGLYGPFMSTVEDLRARGARSPIAAAALLHLHPGPTEVAPVALWAEARRTTSGDAAAALLAGAGPAAVAAFDGMRRGLSGEGSDVEATALLLAAPTTDRSSRLERIRGMVPLLRDRFRFPMTAAAIATADTPFRPEETADWLSKSTAAVTAVGLAPTPGELSILGLALFAGLDPSGLASHAPEAPERPRTRPLPTASAAILHAWMYRDALRRAPPAVAGSAA